VRTYEEQLSCTQEQRDRYLELKGLMHEQYNIGDFDGVLQTAEEYFEYFLSLEAFPQEDFVKFTLALLELFPYDRDSAQAKSYFHYQAAIVKAASAQDVQHTFDAFIRQYARRIPHWACSTIIRPSRRRPSATSSITRPRPSSLRRWRMPSTYRIPTSANCSRRIRA
jgi:hypothetical protein